MSGQSDALATRLRPLLASRPLVEKKMFGGTGFMLNGNMAIGTTTKGELLVRIDREKLAEALARPGAYQIQMGQRPMSGFVAVAADHLDGASLADWLAYSLSYAETLPPK